MLVVTDEHDIVQEVSLIPGLNLELPAGWHAYFPVNGDKPSIGTNFIPNFEEQPWLKRKSE